MHAGPIQMIPTSFRPTHSTTSSTGIGVLLFSPPLTHGQPSIDSWTTKQIPQSLVRNTSTEYRSPSAPIACVRPRSSGITLAILRLEVRFIATTNPSAYTLFQFQPYQPDPRQAGKEQKRTYTSTQGNPLPQLLLLYLKHPHRVPQHALQYCPLQLTDAPAQQTLMPPEQALRAASWWAGFKEVEMMESESRGAAWVRIRRKRRGRRRVRILEAACGYIRPRIEEGI